MEAENSTISLILSIIAVIVSIGSWITQSKSNEKEANAVFANLWLDLDQMFIDHPEMHKYFYTHNTKKEKSTEMDLQPEAIPSDESTYELAICIAEKMVDAFQYAELFKDSLSKKDQKSYYEYRDKIFNTDFMRNTVKPIWTNNGSTWILPEESEK